jgi:hypothetical protein
MADFHFGNAAPQLVWCLAASDFVSGDFIGLLTFPAGEQRRFCSKLLLQKSARDQSRYFSVLNICRWEAKSCL